MAISPKEAATAEASRFVTKLNDIILFPTIALLSGIAFLVFIYGCAMYIINADNETAREDGKKNIMYGLIGLVIMLSAYAILNIAAGTFGLSKNLECADNPSAAGCNEVFKIPNSGGTPSGSGSGGNPVDSSSGSGPS